MDGTGLITVLGHSRVLADAASDPPRRHIVTGPGGVEGVSAYERLYGPQAEGAIAIVVGTPVGGGVTTTGPVDAASSTSGLYTQPVSVALTTWR